MNYLKAIKKAGTDNPDVVMKTMQGMKINDFVTVNGHLRPDGTLVHDMFLVEVKKPSESKGPWDLLKVIKEVPGDEAFMPMSEGTCPLVKGKK
jgi:branched-chain amino acid transport system substrate-binding protein